MIRLCLRLIIAALSHKNILYLCLLIFFFFFFFHLQEPKCSFTVKVLISWDDEIRDSITNLVSQAAALKTSITPKAHTLLFRRVLGSLIESRN